MNPIRRAATFVTAMVTLSCLEGCSVYAGRAGLPPEMAARSEQIGVYEASPPGTRDYRFVSRLWIGPWWSAVDFPAYPSIESGVAEIRAQAVALGGDAVVNFGCYHTAVDPNSDYICNGTVVKFLP